MTVELYIPNYDEASVWLAQNPGVWAVFGAVAWYWILGVVIARVIRPKGEDRAGAAVVWAFSPLIVPIALTICTASVVLWPLSGGIIQPVWRWKESE